MAGIPKGGYGIIGRVAMRSDKVSKEAKAVYALICSYTGDAEFCFPSIATMAKDLKCSEPSIKRYVAELVRHEFIKKGKKIEKGKGAHNRVNAYWPQFIEPENKQEITHDTIKQITHEPIKQIMDEPLLLTPITNKPNTNKNAKPEAPPSLYKQVVDLIGRAHKHLTGSDLSWKGREGRYGKSVKLILENVSGMAPELAFEQIRQKCAAYVLAAQSDKYMKTQGVTPVSIFDFWNKVHFKAGKTVVGDFSKENRKPFPDYKSMSPEQIEAAFHNWKKSWNEFDLKENIAPESYQKFREAGGFNHALPGILIEEVHGQKKTA